MSYTILSVACRLTVFQHRPRFICPGTGSHNRYFSPRERTFFSIGRISGSSHIPTFFLVSLPYSVTPADKNMWIGTYLGMAGQTKSVVSSLVFGLWLVVATVAATILTAWHWVSLPVQAKIDHAGNRIAGWRLRHYLASDCSCSRSVASYLITRGPLPNAAEEIVLLDSGDGSKTVELERRLRKRGFAVTGMTPDLAALREGVEGVPTFEVVGSDSRVVYRGGYRERGAAPGKYLDTTILSDVMAARTAPSLPVYGCATGERLRRQLDPFGFKRF